MSKVLAITAIAFLWSAMAFAQFRQASHISQSVVCGEEISDWVNEDALLFFNTSTQDFRMTTDLGELLSSTSDSSSVTFFEPGDLPVVVTTRLAIPGLDFKSAANNGESYIFNARVTVNGVTKEIPIQFIFLFAPKVSEALNGAPTCPYRIEFSFDIRLEDFNLSYGGSKNCSIAHIKVQEGLLNKLNT